MIGECTRSRLERDYRERARTGSVGLKVNLYTALDVAALDASIVTMRPTSVQLECLMVGDSLLSTHFGRDSTRLLDNQDQRWAYGALQGAVREVSAAMKGTSHVAQAYLIADLPDGSLESPSRLVQASDGFLEAGADVVKLEIDGPESLRGLEHLASRGILAFGHLGFTPQTARLRRYGKTKSERNELYHLARAARDSGACGLVLEMVHPTANASLSQPSSQGLPCFSIFSGPTVAGGGLSINAWDAVFRHATRAKGFPPSAFLNAVDYPDGYTEKNVIWGLSNLLALIEEGRFPAQSDSNETDPVTLEEAWLTTT